MENFTYFNLALKSQFSLQKVKIYQSVSFFWKIALSFERTPAFILGKTFVLFFSVYGDIRYGSVNILNLLISKSTSFSNQR